MRTRFLFLCISLTILLVLTLTDAEESGEQILENPTSHFFLHKIQEWRASVKESQETEELKLSFAIVSAGILSFIGATISSAGGIGGGGLFIPILTIVAGLDLKTASSFSAFMVTGGSIANVIYSLSGKALLDYDLALLLEPCMLLGVSIGVICNQVFPEWIITALFAMFLAWCSLKTCRNGVKHWKLESEMVSRKREARMERGLSDRDEPLLSTVENKRKEKTPWIKLGFLLIVWLSFFFIYLLRENKDGKGIISIKPCGVEYWILLSLQIPLALAFTKWALSRSENLQEQSPSHQEKEEDSRMEKFRLLMFPTMSFLAGMLGGVFGIGGGMLISPLLLQVGISPEVTAATTSFMVFFSSTMSAIQYLLLGMQNVEAVVIFSLICFIASIIGLVLVQKAIEKFGRASIIVFSVGIVMAVSTVLMTSFGALDIWIDFVAGKDMGFKLPC